MGRCLFRERGTFMMRKLLLLLFVLCFISFWVLSCDQPTETTDTSIESGVDSSEPSTSGEEYWGVFEGFVEKPEDFDLEGRTVVVSSWSDEEPKLDVSPDGDKTYNRRKMAEERYNFVFEYKHVPGQAYADMFASSAAAGIFFADIVRSPTAYHFPSWIHNGFYSPLDSVIDFTSEKYSPFSDLAKWIDGYHYYLPASSPPWPPVLVYNPVLLENEGAPDPLELAQKGEWDWDALLKIAEMTTKNIGTQNEQYGLKGWFPKFLLSANGVQQIKVMDGKLDSDLFEQSALNALNFWRTLKVEKQVIDPASWQIGSQNFINGTQAMMIGELWSFTTLRNDMSDFRAVPIPFGPDNEEKAIVAFNVAATGFSPLSEVTLDQLVAIWVNGTATDYRGDMETFIDPFDSFYEGNRNNHRIFDTDEALEYYWEVMTTSKIVLGPEIDGNIMWEYIVAEGSPINQGESPATVLATMENEVRAYLEAILQ